LGSHKMKEVGVKARCKAKGSEVGDSKSNLPVGG